MNYQNCIETILSSKLIVIIRLKQSDSALKVIEALVDGGIKVIEVTTNTPDYYRIIKKARKSFPDILIGAGTVTQPEQANQAIHAGAQYLVTPNTNIETINLAHQHEIPVIMGAFTPTEMHSAVQAGADMIKLFPAEVLGIPYLKAVKATLPDIPIVPTGGINPDNAKDWLNAGAKALGIGSALVNQELIESGDFSKITSNARNFVAAV